jgi:cytochrome P450
LTAQVVAEWLGIPDEYVDQFPDWENKLLTGNGLDEVHAAEARFLRFTYEMLEHKRRNPGDDIYTMLLHIHEQDPEALSEEELLSTFMMLAIAGSEAAKALGNCLLSLMTHRDQFDLLRADPGLLDTAVHECLRYESSFRILSPRFSDKPFELDGVVLPPRSLLVCSVASANRDPDRFPEPDRLDITRHPNHHMSFGHGPHNCLGAGFALLELKTAVKALLDRFADIRLAIPPDELVWRPGMYMRRLNALPVVLVPHAAGAAGPSRSG